MINLNEDQCSKCSTHRCIDACPTGALTLKDATHAVSLNESNCIGCGRCVRFMYSDSGGPKYICDGALPKLSYHAVQDWINARSKFAVVVGPGLEYYNSDIELKNIAGAWRQLGATRVMRATEAAKVALLGIKREIQDRWNSGERLLIDSRCGAIRNLVERIARKV